MRHISLSLAFAILSLYSFAQCPAPEVSSWHFPEPENVDIAFYAEESADSYEVIFTALYNDLSGNNGISETETIQGESVAGLNLISFNVIDLAIQAGIPLGAWPNSININNYYYKVEVRTSCGVDEWSDYTTFYVSPLSLLNNPGFSLDGELYMPIQYLADGAGFMVSVDIEIPEQSSVESIDELGVFVDIGHTHNGDISIKLISPSGTEVVLMETTNFLGGTSGMSLYFTDNGEEISQATLAGLVAPFEALSTLEGEIASGTWTIVIEDNLGADYGFVFGVGLDFSASPCVASISGSAYYDFDGNGTNDGTDLPFDFGLVEDTGIPNTFFTNSTGDFVRCKDEGVGELSIVNSPMYYEPIPAILPYSVEEGDDLTGLDFAMTPIGEINDLVVDIWSFWPDRPGFENNYTVYYENLGTACIEDVSVEVEVALLLEILDVSTADYTIEDNTINVNLGTVCPMETGTFNFSHYLSDTVSLGTILTTSATINPLEGDENEVDNFFRLDSEVVGSYDPNDKQVSAETINQPFLENGESLKYMVRFQNTGTYYAENVVVTDTLDDNLDMSTFQIISISHDMNIAVEGRVLHFNFNDIMLPDSATDLEASNGYLRYSIAPYSDLAEGTIIENTAYIYFDFNEAIITNTTETLVDFASGIGEHYQYEASLYPNPANSSITVNWPNGLAVEKITVFDITGKQVMEDRISNASNIEVLDISHLVSGSYIIQLNSNVPIKPVRWVKM